MFRIRGINHVFKKRGHRVTGNTENKGPERRLRLVLLCCCLFCTVSSLSPLSPAHGTSANCIIWSNAIWCCIHTHVLWLCFSVLCARAHTHTHSMTLSFFPVGHFSLMWSHEPAVLVLSSVSRLNHEQEKKYCRWSPQVCCRLVHAIVFPGQNRWRICNLLQCNNPLQRGDLFVLRKRRWE